MFGFSWRFFCPFVVVGEFVEHRQITVIGFGIFGWIAKQIAARWKRVADPGFCFNHRMAANCNVSSGAHLTMNNDVIT